MNYRPISFLEVPGKILEKIINKRLRTFLETHKLLPDTQHGFRTARSTETALAIITEQVSKKLANKNQCCLALRDVSKAFDKVWHEVLKYKLLHINLPPIFHKLLSSFLDNRTASLKVDDQTGPPFAIHSGVPQGSSLCPTLYTLYIRDIPAPLTDSINVMYADDITQIISYPSKSKKMLAKRTEKEINNINKFEYKWKIKTNMQKFILLPIASKKTRKNYNRWQHFTLCQRGESFRANNATNRLQETRAGC